MNKKHYPQNPLFIVFGLMVVFSLSNMIFSQAGAIDPSFNIGTGANGLVSSIVPQSDGKILMSGNFTNFNGTEVNRITRLNSDGSIDPTFNVGTGANSLVFRMATQNDGKIIISGGFTEFNGSEINYIARINTDGSIDNTFDVGTGANGSVNEIAIQADGKIIIGGEFTHFNGTETKRIARLNPDGSLDEMFVIGTGANNSVRSIAIQNDGKIIIGGYFTNLNGTQINRIARLNTDGSLDLTFNIGTGAANLVADIVVQSDGKIIVGGDFQEFNSTLINRFTRLNEDGSFDPTFNVGTGVGGNINTIAVENGGKILIGGWINSYNGTSIYRITRINVDGSLDLTFNVGTGANADVFAIAVQADGKVLIGGSFISYNEISSNRIARILNDNICENVEGTDIISSCGSISWIDGNTYTTSNNTATFLLEGASIDGCDSLVTLNLTVFPIPTIELSMNGSALTATTGFESYIWTFNGNPIAGATSNTIELGANGVYAVTATNATGCEATDSFTHQTASIEENLGFTNINLFPNPCQGEAILEVQTLKPIQANLKVTDIQGKMLIELQLSMETGKQQIPLNLHTFESGVYFVQILANGTISRSSFIKQ